MAKRTPAANTPDRRAKASTGHRKALRADAQRNRDRILEVASAVLAVEGLSVPVHEIARRAEVGTGTVSRHFSTKESLFEAVFIGQVDRMVNRTRAHIGTADAGEAFFEFLRSVVREGATNRGLVQTLAGTMFDFAPVSPLVEHHFIGALSDLLADAQKFGAVHRDIDAVDVRALIVGCLTTPRLDAQDRVFSVVCRGLSVSNVRGRSRPGSAGRHSP